MRTGSHSTRLDRALRAALVIAPLLAAFVPLWALEQGPDICLFRSVGAKCWGCGMTRALASAARGDFDHAWDYNPRVVLVAPLLVFIWARTLRDLHRRIRRDQTSPLERPAAE
jgi:hypothetical protein